MSLDALFDTNVLIHLVDDKISKPNSWLLDRYFPQIAVSDTQYVTIDVDVGLRRMTPFSSPAIESPLVEVKQVKSITLQPAYLKEKSALDIYRPVRRMIGERIGGDNSAANRAAQNLMNCLENQVNNITRRMEWMAATGLINASLTISGEGVPTQVLPFGRDNALSVTLAGNNLWDSGNAAADPVQNIQDWAQLVLKHSGTYPTDIIFTPSSWSAIRKNSSFKDAFSFPRTTLSGAGGDYRAGNSVEFGVMSGEGGTYLGQWGQFNLFLYNNWYLDSANVEQQMVPDGSIFMTSPALEGIRAYGAIIDPAANYAAVPYFPKSWVSHDPSQRFVMIQSAPIVYPSRVNASFFATVTAQNTNV